MCVCVCVCVRHMCMCEESLLSFSCGADLGATLCHSIHIQSFSRHFHPKQFTVQYCTIKHTSSVCAVWIFNQWDAYLRPLSALVSTSKQCIVLRPKDTQQHQVNTEHRNK